MSGVDIVVRKVREPRDGEAMRVLVDRLWPRGVSKEKADLDEWAKDAAPSTELRKEFHGGEMTFAQFSKRYRSELDSGPIAEGLEELAKKVADADGQVALLIAGDPGADNHADVLADALREHLDGA